MTRARALVAAVPQRVWTAVAGLVLLASLGVTLVLAAGLATWRGAVSPAPGPSTARPPISVVRPPGSSVIVVPTPVKQAQHPVPSGGGSAVTPGSGVLVQQPLAATPTPAPGVTPPALLPQPGQPQSGQPQSGQPQSGQPQSGQPQPGPAVTPQPPSTANPRVLGSGSTGTPGKGHHAKPAKAAKPAHVKKSGHAKAKPKKPKHGDRGKHLGWSKNGHGG